MSIRWGQDAHWQQWPSPGRFGPRQRMMYLPAEEIIRRFPLPDYLGSGTPQIGIFPDLNLIEVAVKNRS